METKLAVLVAEKIASALIPDNIKMQALNDILRMLKDEKYAQSVGFYKGRKPGTDPLLGMMHWGSTDLGFSFWNNMHKIIG
jgi:hypothetical protein